jgi:predicted alpha/beta superfamily hydrolase
MQKTFRGAAVFLLLCLFSQLHAQYRVTFIVDAPASHSADSIFVAGSFNLWNPGNPEYCFTKSPSGKDSLTIHLPQGAYEYKFTRGSWQRGESDVSGKGSDNRKLTINNDTTLRLQIAAWTDDFAKTVQAVTSTASKNVRIMDSAFFMPQLNRNRRIWMYLPPGYASSKKSYPVIYMHDGQNLFDNATSYSGEWGVDEFLDSIISKGKKAMIVVGIDNGQEDRMSEYNPWKFQNFGEGEGDKYVDFLVKTLKPYFDKYYRTLSNKQNTFVAGSSMGGLISLYVVLKYPETFGGAGIFSPAFWTAPGIDSTVVLQSKKIHSKLFFYAGGKEGEAMVPDMIRIEKEIKIKSSSPIKEIIDPEAQHNEAAWRKWFPAFYEWMIER